MALFEQEIVKDYCPYCGQLIDLLVDCSLGMQEYIEDCSVCCRPIKVTTFVDAEGIHKVILYDENS